jgi:hypothetical protein
MDKARKIDLENKILDLLGKLVEDARKNAVFGSPSFSLVGPDYVFDEIDLAETAAREILAVMEGMEVAGGA